MTNRTPLNQPVHVTEPYLPPLEEYIEFLRGIWERKQLTNQGPLAQELEKKLRETLDCERLHFVCNGALGLHLAIKALGISGEVVTTAFSYVATSSSLLWEGCKPVHVDIEPDYLTIDPEAVESAITPRTEAIMATHVFGTPCDVIAIEKIATRHHLAVIYDAAHAFGVKYLGKSILEWGNASMISLHATKVFHTCEGGLVSAADSEVAAKIEWMRRFGHREEGTFHGIGTNAKSSELHAAMGLAILPYVDEIIKARKVIINAYDEILGPCPQIVRPKQRDDASTNGAYYPVIFPSQSVLYQVKETLEKQCVFPRRYFYPSLEKALGDFGGATKVAGDISSRILCLPLFPDLAIEDAQKIAQWVKEEVEQCD